MTRLSESQAKKMLGDKYTGAKPNKYRNRKTVVDGITFDSQKEAYYYAELKLLKRAGVVEKIELQPVFLLQEGFTSFGKKYQPIKYIADFTVYYTDGRIEVVDVKGHKTKEYQLKKKMLLKRYPIINFKEV